MSFDPSSHLPAAERLLLAESRLAALMEHSGEAVFTTDTGGCVTTWSRAAEALFGWDAATAHSKSLEFLLVDTAHGDADREAASLVQRVLSSTATVVITTACSRTQPDDALEARLAAVRTSSGQPLGILVTVRRVAMPTAGAEWNASRTRASAADEAADALERQYRDLARELNAVL
ncbi:MAG TPA: PAS domain-containing protein, partial [Armatimonadota bacterium]|nr:PAS domain-containing protein [Armatimonadota bacterium]